MIIYTTEYDKELDVVRVHATCGTTPNCPPTFRNVAFVVEPFHENPCVQIPKPIGIGGVKRILETFERWRKENAETVRS